MAIGGRLARHRMVGGYTGGLRGGGKLVILGGGGGSVGGEGEGERKWAGWWRKAEDERKNHERDRTKSGSKQSQPSWNKIQENQKSDHNKNISLTDHLKTKRTDETKSKPKAGGRGLASSALKASASRDERGTYVVGPPAKRAGGGTSSQQATPHRDSANVALKSENGNHSRQNSVGRKDPERVKRERRGKEDGTTQGGEGNLLSLERRGGICELVLWITVIRKVFLHVEEKGSRKDETEEKRPLRLRKERG